MPPRAFIAAGKKLQRASAHATASNDYPPLPPSRRRSGRHDGAAAAHLSFRRGAVPPEEAPRRERRRAPAAARRRPRGRLLRHELRHGLRKAGERQAGGGLHHGVRGRRVQAGHGHEIAAVHFWDDAGLQQRPHRRRHEVHQPLGQGLVRLRQVVRRLSGRWGLPLYLRGRWEGWGLLMRASFCWPRDVKSQRRAPHAAA